MTTAPFLATVTTEVSINTSTFDRAVEKAQHVGDDRARVVSTTIEAIEQDDSSFSATIELLVGLQQTNFEDAVTAAYEYCRTQIDEYDPTITKIERNG